MAVDPRNVFYSLETTRESGSLAEKVTSAAVYYETASTGRVLLTG